MKRSFAIVHLEEQPITVEGVRARLQRRFDEGRRANPRGYRDQFEANFESHCMEVVAELGGILEFRDNGDMVFNFTGVPLADLPPPDHQRNN